MQKTESQDTRSQHTTSQDTRVSQNVELDASATSQKATTTQMETTSRRSFMKTSSTLTAAGAVASSLSIANSAHAFGSDIIKIGLVGCGGRGSGAAQQAMDTGNVHLTAMGDIFENRLYNSHKQMQGKKYKDSCKAGDDTLYLGFDAYKSVIDSDIDLVILATPPGFRPLHFEYAVNAGKHVFMEKPIAADAPGVRRILEANKIAKEKNLAVQVGLQRHHQTGYRAIIEKCQDGAIGDIVLARAYWNSDGVWVKNREPEQSELEYQMFNWYYFNYLSGDHITEQHIHNIDVINWLMDGHPVKAQGQGGRQVRTYADTGEIFDHHFVEFTYGNPQATTMLSQCRHIPGCWKSVSEFAHGTKGWADISGGKIYDNAGSVVWEAPKNENGWANEHVDLFAAIRAGERPNEAEYGAHSTMTSIMGRMATYSGAPLTWDECLNSEISLANYDAITSFEDVAPVQPIEEGVYAIPVPGSGKEKYV